MVVFKGTRRGRPFIGVCLTDTSIERLKKDQPIFKFKEDADNILHTDLMIFYAENEDAFMRRIKELELISKDTKITDERSKKDH